MSVCRVAMLSYAFGEPCAPGNYYSTDDLADVIMYCEGLIEEGHTREPHDDFNLRGFIKWASPLATSTEHRIKSDWRNEINEQSRTKPI